MSSKGHTASPKPAVAFSIRAVYHYLKLNVAAGNRKAACAVAKGTVMKHRWEGDTLFFSGVLNEQMSEDSLVKMFSEAQARQTHQKTELSLDFADVVRANSLGLKNWICALERIPIQGWYVRIPPWFVLQLNTIDELSIGGALLVRSFYAPFCHAETGDVTNILVRVGEDLPIKSRYDTTDLMAVVGNDEMLQPDFEEEEYLRFIASFYDRYADIFRPRT